MLSLDLTAETLAEGEGVEPSRRIARPGFQDQLRAAAHHLPQKTIFGLYTLVFGVLDVMSHLFHDDKVQRSKYKDRLFIVVHVVGLAPTKSARTLGLQPSAFAAQPHMRNKFQISNLTSQDFKSEIRCAKK